MIKHTIQAPELPEGNWQASKVFYQLEATMLGHNIYLADSAFGRWFARKRFLDKLRYQLRKNPADVIVFLTLNQVRLCIERLRDSNGDRCLVVAPVNW